MKFQDLESLESAQCALVSHADDADMINDGMYAVEQMQKLIDAHDKLCGATGRHIEHQKSIFQG